MQKQILTQTQTKCLTDIRAAHTTPQHIAKRAGIVLNYAGSGNKSLVANRLHVGRDTVRRWCERWQSCQDELGRLEAGCQDGTMSADRYRRELAALLADAPRPGSPAIFSEEQKTAILALAAEKPEQVGVPVTHWSHELLARTVIDKGIVSTISPAHIGRFLKQSHIETPQK